MACIERVLIGGEPKKRDIKEGESLKRGVTLVIKSISIERRDTYKCAKNFRKTLRE